MLDLRKRLRAAITLILAAVLLAPTLTAQEVPSLQINSERYIVIDAETSEIYAQRGANDRVAIASLTKVFTAVQALNMAPLDTRITTKASDLQSAEATVMGFGPGETYTLRDMIYGMMLPSGNDAAYAIARSLGYQEGDTDEEAVQRFLDLLNQRIEDMGLQNTFLKNPDGWGVPGHYSSAADVAAFMQYASEYPFLLEVMGTSSYTTSNDAITVTNSNKILNSCAPLLGGKTGYDNDSGWCLVNLAESGDTRMIAVTLDGVAPDDWYDDNMTLLEYGFDQKSSLTSNGEAFEGEAVAWNYPDAMELARIGEQRTYVAGETMSSRTASPQGAAPGTGRSAAPPLADRFTDLPSAGPWLASLAAVSLVGLSGLFHWRGSGGTVSSAGLSRAGRQLARLDTRRRDT